jgi:hypothetical protein
VLCMVCVLQCINSSVWRKGFKVKVSLHEKITKMERASLSSLKFLWPLRLAANMADRQL